MPVRRLSLTQYDTVMPLYMDIHTVDSDTFSVEDVVKAHMEDLAVQERFGVVQLKYWVNVDAKTLFCLMEGPDKEACHQVHKQSHGNTACNIIEVSDNEYNLFMGVGTQLNDLAQTQSGELDSGYRTILLTNIVCFSNNRKSHIKEVHKLIEKHNGVLILDPCNEIMVSFIYASDAISCALAIDELLKLIPDRFEFNLAVFSGRPVDEEGNKLFEETKMKVQGLCSLGLTNMMYLDREAKLLSDKDFRTSKPLYNSFMLVKNEDVKLLLQLSEILNKSLISSEIKIQDLCTSLSLSKSQVNRKIKSLTGVSPNQLIQESRLQKAVNGLTESSNTIAEIAYESGFNSPAYFTRVFKKRFGLLPTEFPR